MEEIKKNAAQYSQQYFQSLKEDLLPFWMTYSVDKKHGGFFTCLLRDGTIYDRDKYVWLQGREVFVLSKLYNMFKTSDKFGQKEKELWLAAASTGAKFLRDHCCNDKGEFYFAVTEEGKPLVHEYNIFSDCFACMAFAQYYLATKIEWAKEWALKCFDNIQRRKSNPKGKWSKTYEGTRMEDGLSIYMIDINLCLELLSVVPELPVNDRVNQNLKVLFEKFYDPKIGIIMECWDPEGREHFNSRLVNPGHIEETCWFVLDVLKHPAITVPNKEELQKKVLSCMLKTIEMAWDPVYGGMFYFLDVRGYPVDKLEWSQKLWWVHFESACAFAKAFLLTKEKVYWDWFEKLHAYIFRFHYDKGSEFWGYLERNGSILLHQKGGKWKGFFHTPRACWMLTDLLAQISNIQGDLTH